MTGELHTVGALVCVKVVDIDFLLSVDDGEEVATVREANLVALLHLQLLIVLDGVAQHLAHVYLVLQGEN